MSKSVNIQLDIAIGEETDALDGNVIAFPFENATASDLVNHLIITMELPENADYKVRYRTTDLFGNPKVATLAPAFNLVDGTLYYVYIRPRKDVSPMGSQFQTPPRTNGSLSISTPLSRFSFSSPRGQTIFGRRSSEQTSPDLENGRSISGESVTMTPASEACTTSDVSCAEGNTPGTSTLAAKQLPRPLNPTEKANKGLFLVELYNVNKVFMDKEYKKMKPLETFMFHDVDVLKELDTPRTVAAMVLIGNPALSDYDHRVADAAREYAQKVAVDIVAAAKEAQTLPRNGVKPLVAFLQELTSNDIFNNLGRPGGPIMEAVRKRKLRAARRNGIPPRKKTKNAFPEHEMEELNEAARIVAAASTSEEIEEAIKQTSSVRCQWIEAMAEEKTLLIPESVMAKFPHFKQNATLLKYDFAYTLEHVFNLPVFNISRAMETYASAILALSVSKNINAAEDVAQTEENMLGVGKTLIRLVACYCRQNKKCVADRLIAESQETPSVSTMLAHRREIKQTAPMIFVFNTFPGTHYYVACDDFALKVPGKFSDALQCLASLHYIFNLEYAKEMLQFNLLLENLCEMNVEKMDKTRVNLYYDLKAKKRVLSQNESNSISPSELGES